MNPTTWAQLILTTTLAGFVLSAALHPTWPPRGHNTGRRLLATTPTLFAAHAAARTASTGLGPYQVTALILVGLLLGALALRIVLRLAARADRQPPVEPTSPTGAARTLP